MIDVINTINYYLCWTGVTVDGLSFTVCVVWLVIWAARRRGAVVKTVP